jgi:uncharacterized protein (TIGR02996 family)
MRAEETLLAAIRSDPSDPVAWIALADCLEEEGRLADAELVRIREWLRHAPPRNSRERRQREARMQGLLAAGARPIGPRRRVSITGGVDLEMSLIPPGAFWMGSPAGEAERFSDEGPRHRVTLTKGFWLGVHPVTQRQWRAVMGGNPSDFPGDEHPVEKVSWGACQEFCRKLEALTNEAFRLPTEAQWEYACRAGATTVYSTGDHAADLDRAAWYGKTSGGRPRPVGQKEPNAWGLYDMHGNVLEWCQDGDREYGRAAVVDPVYRQGNRLVVRGGGFRSTTRGCRCAFRYQRDASTEEAIIGCRVLQAEG